MLSVVIDTNVVISAALSIDGTPALILELLFLGHIKNFTSHEIIDEIKNVFNRSHIATRLTISQRDFIVNSFIEFSEIIEPLKTSKTILEDPKDNIFLDCAEMSNASFIITGDEHLLILKENRKTKILSPAEFVENNIKHSGNLI